jgi:two-component system torCAD operon response regulator TorR
LVLDDDPVTRRMIVSYFTNEGYLVEEAGTAAECRSRLRAAAFDLVFVDIHLPDANGIEFAREIGVTCNAGIIFVTQRDCELDRVLGLETVGDDYVIKPINLRELLARARACLRRRKPERQMSGRCTVFILGPYIMDLTRRELAQASGPPVPLTRGEFDLLAALVEANGRPLYRDFLAEVVSTRGSDAANPLRSVDTLVARLRRKLCIEGGGPVIVTVSGIGYRLGWEMTGA